MGDWRSLNSKEDLTMKISNSVFVMNFLDHFSARELWNVCNAYVRFQREHRASMAQHTKENEGIANNSFASVLKTGVQNTKMAYAPSPALVLDDSCILEKDMSCLLIGKIKDINALSNLYVILANEGFEQVNLTYLGEFWVLIDTGSTLSNEKISDLSEDEDVEKVNGKKGNTCEEDKETEVDHVSESSCMNVNGDAFENNSIVDVNETVKETNDDNINQPNEGLQTNQEGVFSTKGGSNRILNIKTGGSILEVMESLIDLFLEGYSFTWSHKSALKMSKLDRFLISEVKDSWSNLTFEETNNIFLLKKKFQALKASIKSWCKEEKQQSTEAISTILCQLVKLDKLFDQGKSNGDLAKIRCSIEGDENSKYFHRIVNKKRSQLAICGILVEGDEPAKTKDLERSVTFDEIKRAVWDRGTNKSPGPDGFIFDFIRRYWKVIDKDVVKVVEELFVSSKFPPGSNSSFITLISKTQDAKMVKDFRPISLIGSTYKIITKIMANRLSIVISDVVSDVQSAFVSNRQIPDVRWDFLNDILDKFGFGTKWREWIQGCLNSGMGSILVNGSPTSEFKIHKELKEGDPLCPFLFILVMESLHLSFNHILNAGLFKGILIDNSLTLSHLFYADDAVFIGKWDKSNLVTIVNVPKCFFLASGLEINIHKSKLMGIGIPQEEVNSAASLIGCTNLSTPFNYLGVKVGSLSSKNSYWEEVLSKISYRLSKWKLKTLSIGGRLTLLKSVLSSMSLYHMSIYKVPMGVLNRMKSLRGNFFNGLCMEFAALLIIQEDVWLTDRPLKLSFPQLYALECEKDVSVASKLIDSSLTSSFRRNPKGGIEEEQYLLFVEIVALISLSNSSDRWVCTLDSAGESSSYLFFSCNVARLLQSKIARWWDLVVLDIHSYDD
uniref:RNA-directed DNA polymerase, eukaryota n=1 Tax=Tanacetum cinerariifolium TaxID=118510 RepID=A0A699HW01_TANCI|nr:RNA-directed DNA polymerase, eukaryota [Tanacetum cinerariifolium]